MDHVSQFPPPSVTPSTSGSASFPALPPELYGEIFQQLDHANLLAILRTSRALRAEALPLYFNHLTVQDNWRNPIGRFVPICTSYAGRFVTTLSLSNLNNSNPHVLPILQSVPNLTTLKLDWRNSRLGISLTQFLPSNPPFRLQDLSVRYKLDSTLRAFVLTQAPSLVRLAIHPTYKVWVPDPEVLDMEIPCLRLLATDSARIGATLAKWSSTLRCVMMSDQWTRLEFVASGVRALNVSYAKSWPKDAAEAFPNLEYLQFGVEVSPPACSTCLCDLY